MFVLRGILAILFGIVAFAWPGLTLAVLILFFGAYAFVDGVFLTVSAISGWRTVDEPWLMLLQGLLGIGVGVLTYINPAITALGLLIYIAAWSLATGVLEIVAAIRLRKQIRGELWLLLGGLASIAFAILLMIFPAAGALGLLWLIAAYAIVFGVLTIGFGLRLYGIHHELTEPMRARTAG
jgi:uncharacterized membrane protein HdeD (DUF308 family)